MVKRWLWLLFVTLSLAVSADGYAFTMDGGGWPFWFFALALPGMMALWVEAAHDWIMWGLNHDG